MAKPAPFPFPATERDLDDLPEDVIGQLIDGELIVHPRPDHPHTGVTADLAAFLLPSFRRGSGGPGGWIIYFEPKIRFGASLLVPDLAGWRKERFVAPRKGPYLVAPDWVCEVLSPSTTRYDRIRKLPIYSQHGVGHAWLLDPRARTLEVFRLLENRWLLVGTHQDDEKVRAEPFEAVELDLALLWQDLPPEDDEEEEP